MESAAFRAAGAALFGERWQGPLAQATGINGRSVRQMAAGARPVPDNLALALDRAEQALERIDGLRDRFGEPGTIALTGEDHPAAVMARALLAEALRR